MSDSIGREEEDESISELLRDRFRLRSISIAEAEAKRNGMTVSPSLVACVSDLAFKYAQQLAKDIELFVQHASRETVNVEDVILCAHRNDHLAASLRSHSYDLKAKEPESRKKKKISMKEDKAVKEPQSGKKKKIAMKEDKAAAAQAPLHIADA